MNKSQEIKKLKKELKKAHKFINTLNENGRFTREQNRQFHKERNLVMDIFGSCCEETK